MCPRLEGAVQGVLEGTVVIEDTPVRFDGGAGRFRLPGLVEGLEDKGVDAPASHGADTFFPEGLCVFNGRNGGVVIGALGWPAGFADPEVDVGGALDGLDVLQGLHDVVKEGERRVLLGLSLPVGEGVGEDDVRGIDWGVCLAAD